MTRIVVVESRVSSTQLRVVDAMGRGRVLMTSTPYNVGDSLLVVNDVIIGKSSKMDTKIYIV